jgi:hypothetical protein
MNPKIENNRKRGPTSLITLYYSSFKASFQKNYVLEKANAILVNYLV